MPFLDPQRHDAVTAFILDEEFECPDAGFGKRPRCQHIADRLSPRGTGCFIVRVLGAEPVRLPFAIENVEEVPCHAVLWGMRRRTATQNDGQKPQWQRNDCLRFPLRDP
jgi:hypothetical protein